jgi:hypothetical protein
MYSCFVGCLESGFSVTGGTDPFFGSVFSVCFGSSAVSEGSVCPPV